MKLAELRRLDEKSEQQANIINSGQIDLWLQEHQQEMAELQLQLGELRGTVGQQAAALHAAEKHCLDRVLINPLEVLEREQRRLRKSVQDSLEVAARLAEFNRQQRSELQQARQDYAELTRWLAVDVSEVLDLDIEANVQRYWQLLDRKLGLERQVAALHRTVKQ